ncbi:MAG: hypothetical protein GY796_08400 [Chloroflexi bacterium]|nr:hypothetical protein [Chloroflexota bacterium]
MELGFVSHIKKDKIGPEDPELLEMLAESFGQVDTADLVAIAAELAARQEQFAEALAEPSAWGQDELAWVAHAVTPSRKKARALLAGLDRIAIAVPVQELLQDKKPVPYRFADFVEKLGNFDIRLRLELASGLLHNAAPRSQWLWTRWVWDAKTQTGVLPLLVGSTHNLVADTLAEEYMRVGSVTAVAMSFAEKTGLLTPELTELPQHNAFAPDVFLACTYSIYLYGVTNWRLSREYNRLLPTLPNLMRRLLGLPKVTGK